MRKVNISFPVLSWGTSTVEVDDDMSDDEILQALRDGDIEFRIDRIESHIVLDDVRGAADQVGNSEIPPCLEIED